MKTHWMQRTPFMLTNGIGKKLFQNGRRNIEYLKETVEQVYKAIRLTELAVEARFDIDAVLPKKITFIHTEEIGRTLPRFDTERT